MKKLQLTLGIALFFVFAPTRQISSEETPEYRVSPYVTCDLRGGIGNQLFQIATTLSYAWDYDAIAIFPDLNRSDSNLSFHRNEIFFRLDASGASRPFLSSFQESTWHSSEKIPFQYDQKLFGYFQSWKHFDHHRDRILSVLAPSQSVLSYLTTKYSDLISSPNTVSIHVRTFNSVLHGSKLHPFLGLEYYKKAIDLFPPDMIFVVFSDRINWCKKHFTQFERRFVFVEGNNAIQDLFLMSMMKHHINANSSFSWWGAYLNQNPGRMVIVPQSMMHPDLYAFPLVQPNEFYLPDWVLVPPNFDAPYPIDMTWYDITQSFDGN